MDRSKLISRREIGEQAVLNRHEGYGKQAPEVRRALINVVRLEQAAKRGA